jgi:hypothetical protein
LQGTNNLTKARANHSRRGGRKECLDISVTEDALSLPGSVSKKEKEDRENYRRR